MDGPLHTYYTTVQSVFMVYYYFLKRVNYNYLDIILGDTLIQRYGKTKQLINVSVTTTHAKVEQPQILLNMVEVE